MPEEGIPPTSGILNRGGYFDYLGKRPTYVGVMPSFAIKGAACNTHHTGTGLRRILSVAGHNSLAQVARWWGTAPGDLGSPAACMSYWNTTCIRSWAVLAPATHKFHNWALA